MASRAALFLVSALAASGTQALDAEAAGHFLSLPIFHSDNADVFKQAFARDVETIRLENRSDVAYYARC
jgi:hypothetical protein